LDVGPSHTTLLLKAYDGFTSMLVVGSDAGNERVKLGVYMNTSQGRKVRRDGG
jgi:hypothetical protein